MSKEKIEVEVEKITPPEVGDEVNYVAPGLKITKAKVVAVDEKSEGRRITVGVGEDKLVVTHRPKDKLAGNTWHFALIAVLLLLGCSLKAGLPTYHTFSAAGNAAAPASVILPADPNSQIRIVNAFYTSDTNTAAFRFSSGSTAYSLVSSNQATTSITNVINATNGLSPGALLVLQHYGACYTNSVVSFGNTGTNGINGITNMLTILGATGTGPAGTAATNLNFVVVGTGGFGTATLAGDEIYLMGTTMNITVGTGTSSINGDDIFSGNYGRPVIVTLSPALATNQINTISAHYDSASQP